ncbi:hypothetical protein [Ruicaihuangia caeni]|uniref:Apea-like HEPN domain-containing protein n=1 Tax=Ruicaihuangia caeni TaxID=3042517 RepID=A0AAW6TC41_9MICO|nr:hypothetical protein [Klugiella sp. YN-L-19]MDI2099563.1 hypothetical protein [Klugiella sp. YN-L-19]
MSESALPAAVEPATISHLSVDQRFLGLGDYFLQAVERLRDTHAGLASAAQRLDDLSSVFDGARSRMAREATTEQKAIVVEVFDSVPESGMAREEFIRRMWEATSDFSWGPDFVGALVDAAHRQPREPLFHGAMLTSAVSSLEAHLAHLAEEYFRAAPEALHDLPRESAKEFSLRDILAMSSIEEALEAAIESRISELSYGNLAGWRAFFKDRMKIEMPEMALDWSALIEVFERRNCIVHHEGRASRRYVRSIETQVSVHDTLQTDRDYVQQAISALELLGIRLHVAVWRKFTTDASLVGEWVEATSFAALRREEWATSLHLYETWRSLPLSNHESILAHVNLLLAKKGIHGLTAAQAEIEAWDVSGLDEIFAFAKYSLLEQLDEAFAMVPELLQRGKLSGWALAVWPLTKPLRADKRIQKYAGIMQDHLSSDATVSREVAADAARPEGSARD